jgi:hypothetical protein
MNQIFDESISMNQLFDEHGLLNRNEQDYSYYMNMTLQVVLHPYSNNSVLHAYAPSISQFLHTFSTKLFKRTLASTISAYLLDQSILVHPRFRIFHIPA